MYENIKEKLKTMLSDEKYYHSISVAETAKKLADEYGCNSEKAYLAGLIHDCAKCKKIDEQIEICKNGGLELSNEDKASKGVLHAKAGVFVAQSVFEVFDEEILSAISYHTTGKENMTLLEKIIYLSDGIEPLRDYEGVKKVRSEAAVNLEGAILYQMDNTITSLLKRQLTIDITTIKARNFLLL